jgi:murein DD-endopeptidase MepM/ murein hydrolase activator NlpD
MTQRKKSAQNRLDYSRQQSLTPRRFASTLPAQSLCWLSSFSLLGGGFVVAQTEPASIDNIVPTIENSQPTTATNPVKKDPAVQQAETAQPDFSERQVRLLKKLHRADSTPATESAKNSQPKEENAEPAVSIRVPKSKAETAEPTFSVRTSKPKAESSESAAKVRTAKPRVETTATPENSSQGEKSATAANSTPQNRKEASEATNNSKGSNTTTEKSKDYNNAYIDPTDYNSNGTTDYQPPSSVVITERASGCNKVLAVGQGASGACAKTTQSPRVAESSNQQSAPNWLKKSETASLAKVPSDQVPPVQQTARSPRQDALQTVQKVASSVSNQSWRMPKVGNDEHTKTGYRANRFIPSPSEFATTTVSATPIAPSAGTLPPPMAEGNVAPRPSQVSYDFALASVLPQVPTPTTTVAYRAGSGMTFPLAMAAPITSLFGWRIHPITGDRRFHAGTDLGAPMGTPVLAAAKGQISSADWMGGYGLAVVINHSSAQQSLYGHLSEIFVRPGQWVEPGTVIGRVGSTGNSTGPHLHFEVRHLTQNGWVAVDPGVQLQASLSQMVRGLRTAQVPQQ